MKNLIIQTAALLFIFSFFQTRLQAVECRKGNYQNCAQKTKETRLTFTLPEEETLYIRGEFGYAAKVQNQHFWFVTQNQKGTFRLYINGKPLYEFNDREWWEDPLVFENGFSFCHSKTFASGKIKKELPGKCYGVFGGFGYLYHNINEKGEHIEWKIDALEFSPYTGRPISGSQIYSDPGQYKYRKVVRSKKNNDYVIVSYSPYNLHYKGQELGPFLSPPRDISFNHYLDGLKDNSLEYTVCDFIYYNYGNRESSRCTRYFHYDHYSLPWVEFIRFASGKGSSSMLIFRGEKIDAPSLCAGYPLETPPFRVSPDWQKLALQECVEISDRQSGYQIRFGNELYGPYLYVFDYQFRSDSRKIAVLFSNNSGPEFYANRPRSLAYNETVYHNVLDFTFDQTTLYFISYHGNQITHHKVELP